MSQQKRGGYKRKEKKVKPTTVPTFEINKKGITKMLHVLQQVAFFHQQVHVHSVDEKKQTGSTVWINYILALLIICFK